NRRTAAIRRWRSWVAAMFGRLGQMLDSVKYLRLCREGAGGKRDEPPPADPAQQIGLGIGGGLGMPAELIVKLFRDDQALLGTRFCSERGRNDERQRIAKRRLAGNSTPEYCNAWIWRGVVQEAACFAGPAGLKNCSGLQKQQPRGARRRRPSL